MTAFLTADKNEERGMDMTQRERRLYLIRELLAEQTSYPQKNIPEDEPSQQLLLRSLFNTRPPRPISETFLRIQDAYWKEETRRKGITSLQDLSPVRDGIYLWQGDITTLKVDGIVNAANSRLLGCFYPCHGCIDNAIHTFAGVRLRLACADIMREEGQEAHQLTSLAFCCISTGEYRFPREQADSCQSL